MLAQSVKFVSKALSVPVVPLSPMHLNVFAETLPQAQQNQLDEKNFEARSGEIAQLCDSEGFLEMVVFGLGDAKSQRRERLIFGVLPEKLPPLIYHLEPSSEYNLEEASLAWLLGSYRFSMKTPETTPEYARLVAPEGIHAARIESIVRGAHIAMELINQPANILAPEQLKEAAHKLSHEINAIITTVDGEALIKENFPLIYTIGAAGRQPSSLVEINWGQPHHPKITIVGKGVCFDTGGLNLKPGSSMNLMKKDMGGAAHALGLAYMIAKNNLPISLKVLLPIVDNSINENAFRPGDILTARNGRTIEINNTDAEGRLILADALSYASEFNPEMIISLATLTGAARVALGPDIVPIYAHPEILADQFIEASQKVKDPLWPMPFYAPYEDTLKSDFADLDNAPAGGFAGSIIAALFLKEFTSNTPYVHFDIYGWNNSPAPARPKGGVAQAIRAIYQTLENTYDPN